MKNKLFLLKLTGNDYLCEGQELNNDYSEEINSDPLSKM